MKPRKPSKLETLLATEGKEALQARMTQHLPLRGNVSRCLYCDGKGWVGFSKCHMCQQELPGAVFEGGNMGGAENPKGMTRLRIDRGES